MLQPVQITMRNLRSSPRLAQRIQKHTQRLGMHHPEIVHCRVAVEADGHCPHPGRLFRVSVHLGIRDREIVANRHENEDVMVAVREAFDVIERQLQKP